jgi:hypothetical protein
LGERIEIGRLDLATVTANVRVAHVVGDDKQRCSVYPTLRRLTPASHGLQRDGRGEQ